MEQQWEIRRVSTLERILDKITHELPTPVGIIFMGEDGEFKKEVISEMMTIDLRTMMHLSNGDLKDFLVFNQGKAKVILDSKQSKDRVVRSMCVRMMHEAGARTVVGVYATPSIILDSPPDTDEMDYLVCVSKETRGASRPIVAADTRPS